VTTEHQQRAVSSGSSAKRRRTRDWSFTCTDCSVNTQRIREYYVVHDCVWLAARGPEFGMLCIGCLEARLGWQLVPDDFPPLPINTGPKSRSARLLERLGHGGK
jgi:hypothetical protein